MTNLEEKKRRLAQLAAACTDPSETESEASEEELDEYSLQTAAGKLLYESFTDEELLNVVRKTAEQLGHSPAQREVFWVYRCYLKRRFEKWPYALQKAGLSKAAGRGGTSMARMEAERKHHRELLERGIQLGRIPHPKDFQDELGDLAKYYQTWNQVLTAAGIHWEDTVHPIGDLEPEYRAMLEELLEQARALGRAPLRSEVEEPLRKKLIARCGSWRNTLYQIGLEPVAHITPFSGTVLSNTNKGTKRHRTVLHECYYKVLNLDERAKRELEEVRRVRSTQRQRRQKNEIPVVAIVGYTNAGKSTLLNAITGAGIPANNRLFDTLDTTTRLLTVSDTLDVVISDTVGFIRKLPHQLVEAFKATLEELEYADLLLHVIDVSNPQWQQQAAIVEDLIHELKADQIPCIRVYNKCDVAFSGERSHEEDAVSISAKTGEGIPALMEAIDRRLDKGTRRVVIHLPYDKAGMLDSLYREAKVEDVAYQESIDVTAVCPPKVLGQLKDYIEGWTEPKEDWE